MASSGNGVWHDSVGVNYMHACAFAPSVSDKSRQRMEGLRRRRYQNVAAQHTTYCAHPSYDNYGLRRLRILRPLRQLRRLRRLLRVRRNNTNCNDGSNNAGRNVRNEGGDDADEGGCNKRSG